MTLRTRPGFARMDRLTIGPQIANLPHGARIVSEGRSGACPTDREGCLALDATVIPLLGLPLGPGARLGGLGGIRLWRPLDLILRRPGKVSVGRWILFRIRKIRLGGWWLRLRPGRWTGRLRSGFLLLSEPCSEPSTARLPAPCECRFRCVSALRYRTLRRRGRWWPGAMRGRRRIRRAWLRDARGLGIRRLAWPVW